MKNLDRTDYLFTGIYVSFHLLIFIFYYHEFVNRDIIKEFYFIVGIISTFLVFDVFSKRLLKKKMLLLWSVIGIIQLVLYFKYSNISDLQTINGTYIDWIKGVPVALFVSATLNFINKKIYGDYFIVTTLRLDSNEKLKDEDRHLRPMDYLFSIIGFVVIIVTVVLS